MKNSKAILLLAFALCLFRCSDDSSSGSGSGSGKVKANFKSLSSGKVKSALSKNAILGYNYGAAAVGAGGLSSFKMYISSIRLCQNLTVTDGSSAYSNPTNCTTIYDNSPDDYSTFGIAAAASAGSGKYFDLLSSTDRGSLSTTTTLDPGTYNYGVINWYRPIKFTATVPLANGNFLYTKPCADTAIPCNATGLDTSPATEAIVDFNNGGTWMKFLKPLVVDGTEDFTVDLAFDLDQRVFGGKDVSNGQLVQATSCSAYSGYCGIYAPILRLSPVVHKNDESAVVETYEMSGPSTEWKIRVDVYYNSGDSDKSVLAADLFPIPTSTTNNSIAAGVYVYKVSESSGVTTFKDVDGNAQLSNFTRADSGTAKLTCPSGASLPGCTAGAQVDVSWSARTIRTL